MSLVKYNWAVIKNCKIIGYVSAYSEYDANRIASEKFGNNIFLERSIVIITNEKCLVK